MTNKQIDDNDYKYSYTDEIVCPFCLYKFSDSWEYGIEFDRDNTAGGTIEVKCQTCDNEFEVTRNITINYISGKI